MELWDRMSEQERAAVAADLPSEFPFSEANPPPEGDPHIDAWTLPRQILRRWAKHNGRTMYVGGNLAIYYPGERMFSPDLIAVLDVPAHDRDSWLVAKEGKGLDLAMEVVVAGKRRKDLLDNLERYARLGISEYFVLDWRRRTLHGYRLVSEGGEGAYERMVPQAGRLVSRVLGLELFMEGGLVRFALGDAVLLSSDELVGKLEGLMSEAVERASDLESQLLEEQRRREEEQHLREEEQRRREALEAEVAALRRALSELEKR